MSSADLETGESVLVIVEGNAATPPWPAHFGVPPEQGWALLEQEEWEPWSQFLKRLSRTLERFRFGEPSTPVVIFVAGSWLDEETVRNRAQFAKEIACQLAISGGGTLFLTHGHLKDAVLRGELTSLAAELAEEWEQPRVVVRTRFVRPSFVPEPHRARGRERFTLPQVANVR